MVNTVDPLKLTYVFTNDAELSFQEKSQLIVKGLVQNKLSHLHILVQMVSTLRSQQI